MMPDIIERYLIELILFGGFLLAGSLARIIADSDTGETEEERNRSYAAIRSVFRIMFAAMLALWLLLFKVLFPFLLKTSALLF